MRTRLVFKANRLDETQREWGGDGAEHVEPVKQVGQGGRGKPGEPGKKSVARRGQEKEN